MNERQQDNNRLAKSFYRFFGCRPHAFSLFKSDAVPENLQMAPFFWSAFSPGAGRPEWLMFRPA
jgi:hypothetical protein